ncbi:hypothetical protein GCM10009608_16320 [Pseudonocardia alaniniphila]
MSAPTVKPALTPNGRTPLAPGHSARRRRSVVENDDYAAFTRRILAAHGRRIARGDIEGLATLAALADDIDQALTNAVTGLRGAGYSWAEIGERLGISRQAAHQRFGLIR